MNSPNGDPGRADVGLDTRPSVSIGERHSAYDRRALPGLGLPHRCSGGAVPACPRVCPASPYERCGRWSRRPSSNRGRVQSHAQTLPELDGWIAPASTRWGVCKRDLRQGHRLTRGEVRPGQAARPPAGLGASRVPASRCALAALDLYQRPGLQTVAVGDHPHHRDRSVGRGGARWRAVDGRADVPESQEPCRAAEMSVERPSLGSTPEARRQPKLFAPLDQLSDTVPSGADCLAPALVGGRPWPTKRY